MEDEKTSKVNYKCDYFVLYRTCNRPGVCVYEDKRFKTLSYNRCKRHKFISVLMEHFVERTIKEWKMRELLR